MGLFFGVTSNDVIIINMIKIYYHETQYADESIKLPAPEH